MTESYNDILRRMIYARDLPTIEVRHPIPGMRHNKETVFVNHRFPVKGGVNSHDHLVSIITSANPILERLKAKSVSPKPVTKENSHVQDKNDQG